MGLFDFIPGVGDDAAEKTVDTVTVSPERIDELRQERITESIAALDIEGEQVTVSVNGEVVVLTGEAPSQEALEKMVLCAGNQYGIAQVDCQLEVDAPETPAAPEATFYTVQSGDTLGKIAAAQYGDAGKYKIIFEANQPMLTDPNKIYPGQSLRVPSL